MSTPVPNHDGSSLVLLPGLDGTGLLFSEFCRALDPSVRTTIVAYPWVGSIDYAGLKAVARSHLPRNEPFVLLAESFSGPIAISIAADRPAGLSGLILSCSFARNPLPMLAPLDPLIRFLPVRWVPVALLTRPTLGRFATPALRSQLRQALRRVSASVIRNRLRALLEVDVSALLARIDVPVLYLRASEDWLIPRAASDELSAISGLRQVEIEGPHFLLQARPAAAAEHVQAFLERIDTRRTSSRRL